MMISSARFTDRKSTRLNSSHLGISYAVFCLKKATNQKAVRAFVAADGIEHFYAMGRSEILDAVSASRTDDPCLSYLLLCSLLFFFFLKGPGPPGILPFSPPAPSPI